MGNDNLNKDNHKQSGLQQSRPENGFFFFFALLEYLIDPEEVRGCSTNTSVIHSVMVCENIFTVPPRPNAFSHEIDNVTISKEILNPEGLPNQ